VRTEGIMIDKTGRPRGGPGLTGQKETRGMTGTGKKEMMGKERKIQQPAPLVRGLDHQAEDHAPQQEGQSPDQDHHQEEGLAPPLDTTSVCPRSALISHAAA